MSYDVKLKDVARLCDHTHFDIPKHELGARRGPYPFYGDLFERFEVDDYGIAAPAVIIMAAAGRVLNHDGGFRLALERGFCGANAFAHVVVPHDRADAEYIAACLASHPHAVDYIGGANQLQTLDELAVLRIALPWPHAGTRAGFVSLLSRAKGEVGAAKAARDEARGRNAADKELAALESRCDAASAAHDVLVNDFMEFGILGDLDCRPCTVSFADAPPSVSDARADWVRARHSAEAARDAAERGGLVVPQACLESLGPVAPLVAGDAVGLSAQDVSWELAPLLVLRACSAPLAWERVNACLYGESFQPDGLVARIDAGLAGLAASNELLAFMGGFSYASSALGADRLARWCRALDAIAPEAVTPQAVRAVFDLAQGGPAVPAQVLQILAGCLGACVAGEAAPLAYLPHVLSDGLCDVVAPAARVSMRCQDNEALFQACMVRAVASRQAAVEAGFAARATPLCALLEDDRLSAPADAVVLEVPDPWRPWSDKPVPRDDPRWTLGAPTRMRPTFAWLEHCLSHLAPGGTALVLLATSQLQTRKPVDKDILARLVAAGHACCAVCLPARIWGDDRPPMSLLVLREAKPGRPCLMVDASACDDFDDREAFSPRPQRVLSSQVAQVLCELLQGWLSCSRVPQTAPMPFCVVDPARRPFEAPSLSPWTYLSDKN